jgi:uncharacterized membrane protein YgcG
MTPKLLVAIGLLCVVTTMVARPQLHNLDIRVVLSRNGDARITETRQMTIDEEGTECYIGLANMGPSQIMDLMVTDETGTPYTLVDWDVHEDRDWKTNRCGIVKTSGGYELCWGLGEEGQRTYITSYTMTGLVRGYPDADALRHVFLDQTVTPKPEHAMVTITMADSTMVIDPDSCGIWGFRFDGELAFKSGTIVVETTSAMNAEAALYVMASFPKGLFEPAIQEETTFAEKKAEALEGSDYTAEDQEDGSWLFFAAVFGLSFLIAGVSWVYHLVKVWRARRRAFKDLLWYRDIPMGGDLTQANDLLNAYRYMGSDYNNLMSACILKLIHLGAITIEMRPTMKGKMEQNFVIHPYEDLKKLPVLMRRIYQIFKQAAGADAVLEPKELRQFMRSSKNVSVTDAFVNTLHSETKLSAYKNRQEDVRQLFGLRKFLQEFTLLDERGVGEVKLWKDYMIYATLFGIADQVIKEMKKVNPEYFHMDEVAGQMADDRTLPIIYSTLHRSTSHAIAAKAARESRANGGGGHSSWGGGGGGFSGCGGGGGVR